VCPCFDACVCICIRIYACMMYDRIMLNFIIAIIVETCMKVVASITDIEVEQEFLSDVTSVMYVSVKSLVLGCPGHMKLIKALKENRKIVCNYATMRRLFPKWGRSSLMGFLKHYQLHLLNIHCFLNL